MRSRPLLQAFSASLALSLSGCGGGGGSPTSPGPGAASHSVVITVFYDENANGTLDASEGARVPGVDVQVAGHTGRSEKLTGRAVVAGVPEGTHAVTVLTASLPPFYQPVAANVSVRSPQPAGADVFVPLTLPIGSNRPHVYMGFGDSITVGEGSQASDGYKSVLQDLLQQHFGRGEVVDEGVSGSRSEHGAERIFDSLARQRPAYTLVLYGTNDWNRINCRTEFPCFTIDSLRTIVGDAKAVGSLPVLCTIPPANPESAQEGRNDWVEQMNALIRPLAREQGAALADVDSALRSAGDLTRLFSDRVHPNDEGYRIIAIEIFRAITTPLASGSARPAVLLAAERPE